MITITELAITITELAITITELVIAITELVSFQMMNCCLLLALVLALPVDAGPGLYTGPYFKDLQPLNITVHKDTVAYLPCVVRQLGNKKVNRISHAIRKVNTDITSSHVIRKVNRDVTCH